MKKILIILCLFTIGFSPSIYAQYTETINANRPGLSQGGFAVGRDVLQVEVGPYYGVDNHDLTDIKTKSFGSEYEIRYGLLLENLELNIRGDFNFIKQEIPVGGTVESISSSNFRSNTIGAKYLIYDPYKMQEFEKPNLYSWKANNSFKWRSLIPVITAYAGYNFTPGSRPEGYPFFGGEIANSSLKLALITQHNWGRSALVMNFIADRLTDDHKRYSAIFTFTQAVGMRSTIFAEFQTIIDDFYSDELLRLGGAYLIMPDLQVDLSGMVNFKNTPFRWQVGVGAAYRFDFHSIDEKLKDPNDKSGGQEYNLTPSSDGEGE